MPRRPYGPWGGPRGPWRGGPRGPWGPRRGRPVIIRESVMPGLGLGNAGGLIGDIVAGGIGYLVGKNSAQQDQQYQQQQPYQQQPPVQQYQQSTEEQRLQRLNLLGQMRAQGTLTEEEFQREKQRILNGY